MILPGQTWDQGFFTHQLQFLLLESLIVVRQVRPQFFKVESPIVSCPESENLQLHIYIAVMCQILQLMKQCNFLSDIYMYNINFKLQIAK